MAASLTTWLLAEFWPIILAFFVGFIVNIVYHKVLAGGGSKSASRKGQPQDMDNYVLGENPDEHQGEGSDHSLVEKAAGFIPYRPKQYPDSEMIQRAKNFYEEMNARRSVRFFSDKVVPRKVLDYIIHTAGTSPSGAHTEPWSYVVVSNLDLKKEIRHIVEGEEQINYERRMGQKWVEDLQSIGTTWQKPYMEKASYIIVVFKQTYGISDTGGRKTHYYSEISISISVGILLAAIQHAGLVTVTTTPMNAGPRLRTLLDRPENEKAILLLPIGFPADDAIVPNFVRKPLNQMMTVVD